MNEARPFIRFINHASVLISNGHKAVLSDPWYLGPVFHMGWSLLHETSLPEILKVLDETDYIWISHEHPDHFSPPFFTKPEIRGRINDRRIKMIVQTTRDRRIAAFLNSNRFEVIELEDRQAFRVDDGFEIYVHKSDFYDSAMIARVGGQTIYKLNDCPILS